jgi:hypothetical protein
MIGKLLSLLARVDLNSTHYSTNASASIGTTDFGNIEIQLQDDTGNWRTGHVTRNIPAMIVAAMEQLASQYPGKRVRAVNSEGRLIDIL